MPPSHVCYLSLKIGSSSYRRERTGFGTLGKPHPYLSLPLDFFCSFLENPQGCHLNWLRTLSSGKDLSTEDKTIGSHWSPPQQPKAAMPPEQTRTRPQTQKKDLWVERSTVGRERLWLLELINNFSIVTGYKIHLHKSIVFLYISNEQHGNKVSQRIQL